MAEPIRHARREARLRCPGGSARSAAGADGSVTPALITQSMRARQPNGDVKIPTATYRLQFNRDFTFEQATALVDYLHDLGISDLYSSPILKAGPTSSHGYDVCSFEEINQNPGGEPGFISLGSKLQQHGLGLLLDFVPNHMGADCSNSWLTDVLTHGERSQFASVFDIDWHSPVPGLKGKILIPTLEDLYSKVL